MTTARPTYPVLKQDSLESAYRTMVVYSSNPPLHLYKNAPFYKELLRKMQGGPNYQGLPAGCRNWLPRLRPMEHGHRGKMPSLVGGRRADAMQNRAKDTTALERRRLKRQMSRV